MTIPIMDRNERVLLIATLCFLGPKADGAGTGVDGCDQGVARPGIAVCLVMLRDIAQRWRARRRDGFQP